MGATHGATNARDSSMLDEVGEAAAFATGGGHIDTDLSSRVELHVSCKGFKKKCSACAIVYVKRTQDTKWTEVGRTETIPDAREPDFVRSVILDYCFEIQQKVHIEVYNMIRPADASLDSQDYLGCMDCFLGEVVGSREKSVTKKLVGERKGAAECTVAVEELERAKDQVFFVMRCTGLPKMDAFSASADPYAIVYRTAPGDDEGRRNVPIYRTEVLKRTRDPTWMKIELSVQQLCRGVDDRPIHIEVWDWNRTSKHKLIGACETNFQSINRAAQDERPLLLTLYDKTPRTAARRKKGGLKCCEGNQRAKQVGQLILEDILVERKFSFLDYINGGMEVGLIVAVDFTRSNGDPRSEESLHYYNDATTPNDYVMALRGVTEILQHYDSDNMYPVLGFGARVPPTHTVCSHCFALNGNIFDPEVEGINEIVKTYRRALGAVSLHGPTHFRDIIRYATNVARPYADVYADEQKYFILMILCDGVINDMQETIDEIVRASETPLSIVIVGVGDEDFALMDELDADERPLYSVTDKKYMERDIVQFVPFNEYKDKSYTELAMALLDEIPREVVNYFKHKAPPKPPPEPGQMAALARGPRQAAKPEAAPEPPSQADKESELPKFLKDEKMRLLAAAVSQGYAKEDVEDILRLGLPSLDMGLLVDVLTNGKKGKNPFLEVDPTLMGYEKRQSMMGAQGLQVQDLVGFEGSAPSVTNGSVPGGPRSSALSLPGAPSEFEIDSPPPNYEKKRKKKKKAKRSEFDDDMAQLCKVCFENEIDCVLLECGHQIVCLNCSKQIGTLCPFCRQPISKVCPTIAA